MEARLDASYGPHIRIDTLLSGSTWDEPKDWMTALKKEERYLQTQWKGTSSSTLKDHLSRVGLIATALSTELGFLSVEYYFENNEECNAEAEAAEDDAL